MLPTTMLPIVRRRFFGYVFTSGLSGFVGRVCGYHRRGRYTARDRHRSLSLSTLDCRVPLVGSSEGVFGGIICREYYAGGRVPAG